MPEKYGARVYFEDGVILVMQTIKRGDNPGRYVVDHDENRKRRQRFVQPDDDRTLVEAIREAGQGNL